jgi:sulfate adenylyltransferase (ADP) / ATP adenylyltransferase
VKEKKPDPFDNPAAELLVAAVPTSNPSHNLVLNKFPVIENHFILATLKNKAQTQILEEDDIAVTYECLKSWDGVVVDGDMRRLYAFFNSGEYSGASQAHRHIQFLPVESMQSQDDPSSDWKLLIDIIHEQGKEVGEESKVLSSLPLKHFVRTIPRNATPSELHNIYSSLYNSAASSVYAYIEGNPSGLELHSTDDDSLPISYNLAMTTEAMAICPRRKEGSALSVDDDSCTGFIAINGTVLSGSIMVKGESEWMALKSNPSKFDQLLCEIGIPQPPMSVIESTRL